MAEVWLLDLPRQAPRPHGAPLLLAALFLGMAPLVTFLLLDKPVACHAAPCAGTGAALALGFAGAMDRR